MQLDPPVAVRPYVAALALLLFVMTACGSDNDDPVISPGLPLSVEGLLTNEPSGEVSVVGAVVIDANGARLCSALAESFPPQCGGEIVELVNVDAFDLPLQEEQNTRWTDPPVVLTGTYDNGAFTISAVG